MSLGIYAALAFISRRENLPPLWLFLAAWGSLWGILGIVSVLFLRNKFFSPAFWLGWGLLFRTAGFFGTPLFDDDYVRYLWDGYVSSRTGSPYGAPPAAFFNDDAVPENMRKILDGVDHPDVPTIYGPICQAFFLAGYKISPGDVRPLKAGLLIADAGTLLILLSLAGPTGAAFYAWCPLSIIETGFNAHPDALGIFFALSSYFLLKKRRPFLASILAALACGTRAFALIPALTLFHRRGLGPPLFFLAALGILYGLWGGDTEIKSWGIFLSRWEFNSSVFSLLSLPAGKTAGLVAAGIIFGGYCLFSLREPGPFPSDKALGIFFLLSPVVNPWYLQWLAAFSCFGVSVWATTAASLVGLSYVHGLHGGGTLPAYQHPFWVRGFEYGGVAAALIYEKFKMKFRP